MTRPVTNWPVTYPLVELFADLDDQHLIHYGPHPTWGQLSSRSLGTKAIVIQGEIDFGCSETEMAGLKSAFPNKRLSPLVAKNISSLLTVIINSEYSHSIKVTIIPSLPFPKVSFNASIFTADPHHQDVIVDIQNRWSDKTLLRGGMTLEYEMVECECSVLVNIPLSDIHKILNQVMQNRLSCKVDTTAVVSETLNNNAGQWISNLAQNQSPTIGRISEIKAYVTEELFNILFQERGLLITFDNGEKLAKWVLVDQESTHKEYSRRLHLTGNVLRKWVFFS